MISVSRLQSYDASRTHEIPIYSYFTRSRSIVFSVKGLLVTRNFIGLLVCFNSHFDRLVDTSVSYVREGG